MKAEDNDDTSYWYELEINKNTFFGMAALKLKLYHQRISS